jgi:hypothetical protein
MTSLFGGWGQRFLFPHPTVLDIQVYGGTKMVSQGGAESLGETEEEGEVTESLIIDNL